MACLVVGLASVLQRSSFGSFLVAFKFVPGLFFSRGKEQICDYLDDVEENGDEEDNAP
jgi:hypothetical protein